ncbi:hypothetical protein EYF80_006026 [Liparis tanakae]|uniref:Uncharacterized protein n=1 Tax=Liparis tanakae TaxID=230148 RepID=A0A4Z2J0Q1_9TELE|nr:hypothetical protein EYF80_006026 [Liparis tanakae]
MRRHKLGKRSADSKDDRKISHCGTIVARCDTSSVDILGKKIYKNNLAARLTGQALNSGKKKKKNKKLLLVSYSLSAGRTCLPALVVSMLKGPQGDAPERPVLRGLLQPEPRDEMPKGHALSLRVRALLARADELLESQLSQSQDRCGFSRVR